MRTNLSLKVTARKLKTRIITTLGAKETKRQRPIRFIKIAGVSIY